MSENRNDKYIGYIYKIINNVNDKIYVGQTTTTIDKRWRGHIAKSKEKNPNMAISRAIKKHGIENFQIEKIYEINCNSKTELLKVLNEKEIYYIHQYNSIIPNGYNITNGGDNVSPKKLVKVKSFFANGKLDKKYDSIIEAAIDRNYENCSTLISKCCHGEMEYCLGRVWRFEFDDFGKYKVTTPQKIMDRFHCETPVDKYSKDGTLICSYDSLVDACVDLNINKYSSTLISLCCNGKNKTAYDFVWRYRGDDFYKYNSEVSYKKISQYTIDGIFIRTFNNISEVIKELNLKTGSNIYSVCNGNKYTAYGYIWRYFGEPLNSFQLPSNKRKSGRKFKKINQYKEDVFVKTFDTSIEAAKSIGARQTSINTACRRKGSCYGYKWFYANDPNQPDKTKIIA